MRLKTVILFAAGAALSGPWVAEARDLFAISWRATCHFVNASGQTVTKSFTERDVVQRIAQDNGLNPSDCVLVYRPDGFDTAVVFKDAAAMARAGATDQTVADYVQMPDVSRPDERTDISNADGTQIVREAVMNEEDPTDPQHLRLIMIGSIFGTERQRHSSSGALVSESYHGTFQFSPPASDNRWQQGVYTGTFSTGGRVNDVLGN